MRKKNSLFFLAISFYFLVPAAYANAALVNEKNPDTGKSKNPIQTRPLYTVKRNRIDTTLKKEEALFNFKFIDGLVNLPVTKEVKMSSNGFAITTTKNANGKFSLKVKPGKYKFQFYYAPGFSEITTDSITIKPRYKQNIEIVFQYTNIIEVVDKPVIYVYPKEKTDITIQLSLDGKLNFTYPEYKTGWNFTAEPNGTISMNNKKFNYLFWEGEIGFDRAKLNNGEGFLIKKENLLNFFEEKLTAIGLNSKEQEDFITYWYPRMAANESNFIHFLFNEEFNEYAKLTIEPKPDKVFRVFMTWSKTNEKTNIPLTEQKIPAVDRKGFTVLEWGGTEMKMINP